MGVARRIAKNQIKTIMIEASFDLNCLDLYKINNNKSINKTKG